MEKKRRVIKPQFDTWGLYETAGERSTTVRRAIDGVSNEEEWLRTMTRVENVFEMRSMGTC